MAGSEGCCLEARGRGADRGREVAAEDDDDDDDDVCGPPLDLVLLPMIFAAVDADIFMPFLMRAGVAPEEAAV